MAAAGLCPICKRPIPDGEMARFRPFCSRRCADVDLGRWLKGGYAIPASGEDEPESADEAGPEEPGPGEEGPHH